MPHSRLTPEAWLTALLAPATQIEFNRATFLGRWVLSNWRIAPRVLDEHLFYWIVQGAADGRIGAEPQATSEHLTAGACTWVMPGVPHAFQQAAGCRRLVLYNLRFGLTQGARRPRLVSDFLISTAAIDMETAMAAAVEELQAPGKHTLPLRKALIAQLAVQVLRAAELPADAPPTLNRFQRESLQRYVEDHAADRIQPAALARLVDLSPDYFTRIFRRTFRLPPRVWILRQRIRMAAVALAQSTGNISQIATRLGYPDIYLFSRQFKQVMGKSPRRYRAEAGAPPPVGRSDFHDR